MLLATKLFYLMVSQNSSDVYQTFGFCDCSGFFISPLLKYQQHTVVCVDPVTVRRFGIIKNRGNDQRTDQRRGWRVSKEIRGLSHLDWTYKIKDYWAQWRFMCVDASAYLNQDLRFFVLGYENYWKTRYCRTWRDFGRKDFFRITLTSSRVVEGVEDCVNIWRVCNILFMRVFVSNR